MTLKQYAPFYNSLIYTTFEQFNGTEVIKDVYDLKSKDQTGVSISNSGGWQSQTFGMDDCPTENIANLVKMIVSSMEQVYGEYGLKRQVEPSYWFNINKKGDHNKLHRHTSAIFAGVFYLLVPENSGSITFYRPTEFVIPISMYTEANKPHYTVTPENNFFLAFPGALYHDVGENTSDQDRISMAFNFR
jgi:uncharacterized protein (TIGR02466 family)